MVFLGIAFILTFLNNYSLTAVSFNLLLGSLAVQWYILGRSHHYPPGSSHLLIPVSGFLHSWSEDGSGETLINVNMASFLYGEYAAAAVLVTFCVVLGKVSILQLLIMALFEVIFQGGNF